MADQSNEDFIEQMTEYFLECGLSQEEAEQSAQIALEEYIGDMNE